MIGKYPVITLCGSTRFKDAFQDALAKDCIYIDHVRARE